MTFSKQLQLLALENYILKEQKREVKKKESK